jgi:hypothetical protein
MALSETNCDWERTTTGIRCKRTGCGNRMKVPADYPLERCHAECWALTDRKDLKERREKKAATQRRFMGRDPTKHPCRYQGDKTGEQAQCRGCGGKVVLNDLYACDIYGQCLPGTLDEAFHCCSICDDYQPLEE